MSVELRADLQPPVVTCDTSQSTHAGNPGLSVAR